jgi:hypothetical protein
MSIKLCAEADSLRTEEKDFAYTVKMSQELGFKYIEPEMMTGRCLLNIYGYCNITSLENDPMEMRKLIEIHGLKVPCLSTHSNLLDTEYGVDYLKKAIRFAYILGAPIVNTAEGPKPGWMTDDDAFRIIGYNKQTGLDIENIMVSASHTHSGPYTSTNIFDGEEGIDEEWFPALPNKMAEAILLAYQSLKEAKVGAGSGCEESICYNRRMKMKDGTVWNSWLSPPKDQIVGPSGPIDPEVGVLKVEKMEGATLGAIINFSCHNNAGGIRGISADFAEYAAKVIENVEGEKSVALFMPGACGNIGPKPDARKTGKILGAEALKTLVKTPTVQEARLAAIRREVDLPLREFELQLAEVRKIWPSGEEVFRKEMEFLKRVEEDHISTYVQTLAIDNTAFVAVPGEMFVELGLEIKQKSPFEHTFVVELANDYVGYIPTRIAFDEGGYETLNARSSRVALEAGEIVVENTLSMLASMAKSE